jgi:hypothetical protein
MNVNGHRTKPVRVDLDPTNDLVAITTTQLDEFVPDDVLVITEIVIQTDLSDLVTVELE